jgi:hypothetical protein
MILQILQSTSVPVSGYPFYLNNSELDRSNDGVNGIGIGDTTLLLLPSINKSVRKQQPSPGKAGNAFFDGPMLMAT